MPPSMLMNRTCRAVPIGLAFSWARTLTGRKALRYPPTRPTPPTRSSSRRVSIGMFRSLFFIAFRTSVVEDEIELVQQTPVQVFGALLAILLDPPDRNLLLLLERISRQRGQIKLIHYLRARLGRFHQLIDQAAIGGRHSFGHKRAVHQRHRLQDRADRLAIKLLAIGLAEGAQETLGFAVVDVFWRCGLGPETRRCDRRVVDVVLTPVIAEDHGGLRDRVVNLFGGQLPDEVAREVRRVALLPFDVKA